MCVHIQKYKHRYIDIDIYKYKRNFVMLFQMTLVKYLNFVLSPPLPGHSGLELFKVILKKKASVS